jgi:flagellar assembly protein FliH
MVDKTRQVEPGKLTAYERWELPNIGEQNPRSHKLVNTNSQKIKPPTAEDIETIRKQAYDAGFEEGRKAGNEQGYQEGIALGKVEGNKQGLAQGLAEGQAQINQTLAQLEVLLAELVGPLSKQQTLLEEAMLNVAMAVARTVIHRELSLDSSSIQQAIHAILLDLPQVDKGFLLKINPKDEAFIKPILDQYESAISLKLDNTITPGGCLLSSSSQLIDYTIEKRFQKTVQAMLNVALQGNAESQAVEVPPSIGALSDYPSDTLDEFESSFTHDSKPASESVDDSIDTATKAAPHSVEDTTSDVVSDLSQEERLQKKELPESDTDEGLDHDK